MGRNSNGPIYYVGLLTVLVITFAVAIAAYNYLAPGLGLSSVNIGTQPDQQTGLVSVTKPVTVSVRDAQAGTAVDGATISLLDSSFRQLEVLTTSNGVATTTVPYSSGTQLYFAKSATGYVTEYSQRLVPMLPRADAYALSANIISETMTKKPSLVITVTDRNGNVISNSGAFNMSGLTSAQFTVTVVNTLDNSGWKTSYDPVNKVSLGLASLIAPSDKVVVTGPGTLVNRGAVSNLVTTIPDAQITKQAIGSQVTGGSYSYSFTVNRGTLQAGQNATISISALGYFDQAYYSTFGIGGPLVESLASFSMTIMG